MQWLFRAFKLLLVVTVLGALAMAFIPGKRLAELAIAHIESQTGRKITLTGDVKTKVLPRLSVITGPITFADAKWADGPPMLTAPSATIGVNLIPLLRGRVTVREVQISNPTIKLEINKAGLRNWDVLAAIPQKTDEADKTLPLNIYEIGFEGAEIRLFDFQSNTQDTFQNVDSIFTLANGQTPAGFTISGQHNGTLFETTSQLMKPREFLAGRVSEVSIKSSYDGVQLEFDGKLGLENMEFDGIGRIETNQSQRLLQASGIKDLSTGGKLVAHGKIIRTANGDIYLRDGKINLYGQEFKGDLDLVQGAQRPKLKGIVQTNHLTVPPLPHQYNQTSLPALNAWSDHPFDFKGLFALDAEVWLSANTMEFGALHFGESQMHIELANGRAVINLLKIDAYGGVATGELVVNGRSGGSVGADLNIENVDISPFIYAVSKTDSLSGGAAGNIKLLGLGDSQKDIVQSLSGHASLRVAKGEIKGLSLGKMVLQKNPALLGPNRSTNVQDANARFDLQNGVAKTRELSFVVGKATLTAQAAINFSQHSLDGEVSPRTSAATQTATPFTLNFSGPWSKIAFSKGVGGNVAQSGQNPQN